MNRKYLLVAALIVALVLSGCNFTNALGGPSDVPLPTLTPAVEFNPTAAVLAPTLGPVGTLSPPTLTPSPQGQEGPTPLPAPTQIGVPTATPGGSAASGDQPSSPPSSGSSSGPGITVNPQLGEPGDITIVEGSGFSPNVEVVLHWGSPDGDTGPEYWKLDTDERGNFSVGLIVPLKEDWPGGNPKEGDYIQIRATAEELRDFYYWANYRYIKRFGGTTSLALTFQNTDWDYEIDVPNGWTWTWTEDKTENVRFASPSGSGKGFVRVIETTSVTSAISTVMTAEGLTATSSAQATLGNFPGTEVKTSNGRTVWFIPARGRIYALSFVDDAGQFFQAIAASLRIL